MGEGIQEPDSFTFTIVTGRRVCWIHLSCVPQDRAQSLDVPIWSHDPAILPRHRHTFVFQAPIWHLNQTTNLLTKLPSRLNFKLCNFWMSWRILLINPANLSERQCFLAGADLFHVYQQCTFNPQLCLPVSFAHCYRNDPGKTMPSVTSMSPSETSQTQAGLVRLPPFAPSIFIRGFSLRTDTKHLCLEKCKYSHDKDELKGGRAQEEDLDSAWERLTRLRRGIYTKFR